MLNIPCNWTGTNRYIMCFVVFMSHYNLEITVYYLNNTDCIITSEQPLRRIIGYWMPNRSINKSFACRVSTSLRLTKQHLLGSHLIIAQIWNKVAHSMTNHTQHLRFLGYGLAYVNRSQTVPIVWIGCNFVYQTIPWV